MMRYIGFEREDEAEEWARKCLGLQAAPELFRALSAVDDKGEFVCVVVMTNFTARNIDVNIAVQGKMTPEGTVEMFNGVFGYVFDKLRAVRVTGLLRGKNEKAKKITEQFGFKLEGVMRKAFEDDDDMHIYGFLAEEFKAHAWYRG
jgi:hypothetical protein